MRVASSRRPDRSTQSLAIALTFSFLTPFIRPVAAAETWNPTLRFNWTLATTDAMVALSGWVPRGPGAGATMDRDMSGSVASSSLGIQFVGDGVAFWGTSNGWDSTTRLGPDKNTASVTNSDDPSFNPSYQQINAPSRPDVLWERNPPRFKAYDISINAYYGNWTLERVEVMTGFQSDKPDLALVPTRTENLVTNNNGSLNPFYNYYGRWLERDAGSGVAVCYDTAEFMAPVPPGTGYLVINGTRSPAARAFAVKVQGPSSDYLYDIVDSSYTSTIDDSMLWMTPLDPDIRYNLTFDCVSAPEGENGVRSVTFYEGTPKGPLGGSGSNGSGGSGSGSKGSDGNNGGGTGSSDGSSNSKMPWWVWLCVAAAVVVLLFALGLWRWLRRRAARAYIQSQLPPPHGNMAQYTTGGPLNGPVDIHYEYEPMPYTNPTPPASVPPLLLKEDDPPAAVPPPLPSHAQDGGTAMNQLPPAYDSRWKWKRGA